MRHYLAAEGWRFIFHEGWGDMAVEAAKPEKTLSLSASSVIG